MPQHFYATHATRLSMPELDPTIFKADAEGVNAFKPNLDTMLARGGPSSHTINFFLFLSDHTLDQVTNIFSLLQKGWVHLSYIGGSSTVARAEAPAFSPLWGHRNRADTDYDFERKVRAYLENFNGKVTYEQKLVHEHVVHVIGVQLLRPGMRKETILTLLYRLLNTASWVETHMDMRLSTPSKLKSATFDAISKHRQRGLPPPAPRDPEATPARRRRRSTPPGVAAIFRAPTSDASTLDPNEEPDEPSEYGSDDEPEEA